MYKRGQFSTSDGLMEKGSLGADLIASGFWSVNEKLLFPMGLCCGDKKKANSTFYQIFYFFFLKKTKTKKLLK